MGNKIKLQHYVPRFYLKKFTFNRDKDLLYCFDKAEKKNFTVNISKIGCESYFYDISVDVDQKFEKILSDKERKFSVAYHKLIRKRNLKRLSTKERRSIAELVALQELRTKEYREMLRNIVRGTNEALLGKGKLSEELKKQLEEDNTEDSIKSMQIKSIQENISNYGTIISKMNWILLENITHIPYWTSDHPINRYNDVDMSPYGNLGFLSTGIQIFFPLTPRLALAFCDPEKFRYLPEFERNDLEGVTFQNSLQVNRSTRHIFCNLDDFSLAEKILEENPSLGDIDRKRISID